MAVKILKNEELNSDGSYFEFDTESGLLGEGGMGRVYLGKKVEKNGEFTYVAIKAMFEGLPEQVIERARREASIRIHNDSLVRMYGFIETVDKDEFGTEVSHYHVVSEYLDGITLEDLVMGKLEGRDGKTHPEIARLYKEYMEEIEGVSTRIIKSVLSGVMALHDAGYIHRDIDPSNIMVTTDGRIKLIDFGVAKQLVRLSTADKGLTSAGQFIGKAGYASPELVLGDVRNQNYSTDVYAIGILYFYLLTGHLPFQGSSYDMIKAQLNKKLPLREICSRQISSVIRKATEKKQSDRFVTSAQMRAAIDSFRFPERWYQDKMVLSSLGIILVVAIGVVMYVLSPSGASAPSVKTPAFDDRFGAAVVALNEGTPEVTAAGLDSMRILAEEGYAPAMYEMAYTYLRLPKDTLSLRRKRQLGLETDKTGYLVDRQKNEEAVEWLRRYLEKDGENDTKALLLMGSIYLNGDVVKPDYDRARKYFERGYEVARKEGNQKYMDQIEIGLQLVDRQDSIHKANVEAGFE